MSLRDTIGDIIYELADNRGKIESSITNLSRPIVVHLIKIYLWRDTTYKNHWISELNGFLNSVPKLKGKNRYPKSKDLYRWLWTESRKENFSKTLYSVIDQVDMGEGEFKDLKRPDGVDIDKVKMFVEEYMMWISQELSVSGEIMLSEIRSKIDSLLKKHQYRID